MALTALLAAATGAQAQTGDPAFVSMAAGGFDFNRRKDPGAEFRLEVRSARKFLFLKPFAALAVTSTGSGFFGAGVLLDVYFGRRIVVTPSFAPHFYVGGNDKLDLD